MKELCYFGDNVLRKKCKEVEEINPFILNVIKELKETVKAHNGAGLAAPQIGYDLRIFINVFDKKTDAEGFPLALEEPEVYINPKIVKFSKRKFLKPEGCLSIPGVTIDVERAYEIDIEYMNLAGEKVLSKKEKKWRAKCLQHEMDHLDGVLFIDHISKEQLHQVTPTLVSLEKRTKQNKNKTINAKDFI